MIVVEFHGIEDVARLIDGLLEAADACEVTKPFVSRAYVDLANRVGDKLDELPNPSSFRSAVEGRRARHAQSQTL